MTRRLETTAVAVAVILLGFGIAFVNVARGQPLDAEVGLTFLVFALAWGGLLVAIRLLAPRAITYPVVAAAALGAIGLVQIHRLDPSLAGRQRWWFLVSSAAAIGLLALLRRTGLATLARYRYLLLVLGGVLLLLPLFPDDGILPIAGRTINGSRLWVQIGVGTWSVQFQPGELAKLPIILFLASLLADRRPIPAVASAGRFGMADLRRLVPVLVAWSGAFVVLVVQRDLGASLLLFATFVTMLYAATGHGAYLVSGAALFAVGAVGAWLAFGHVQTRIEAWLRPFDDPFGTGYQIVQGLYAMGAGSLTGSGLGLGRPDLIPFAATDFIYAAIAEELGLTGSLSVLALFGLLVAAGAGIALRARDQFRSLLAAGITFVIGIQAILIIGGTVRLLPLTGITLPFMSYGGSSLLANFLLLALLLRVSHEERA
ncbi:MAG: FtsW/RodA/SpoVE family cell cycle protein [Acidimicrobiia bacterium]